MVCLKVFIDDRCVSPFLAEKAGEYGLQLLHRNTHLEQEKESTEQQLSSLRHSHDELKQVYRRGNDLIMYNHVMIRPPNLLYFSLF